RWRLAPSPAVAVKLAGGIRSASTALVSARTAMLFAAQSPLFWISLLLVCGGDEQTEHSAPVPAEKATTRINEDGVGTFRVVWNSTSEGKDAIRSAPHCARRATVGADNTGGSPDHNR